MKGLNLMSFNQLKDGDNKGAYTIWGSTKYIRVDKKEEIYTKEIVALDSKASDSIWMTSFVVKLLGKAKHLTKIDDKQLTEALKFLMGKQDNDGSFPEYSKFSRFYLISNNNNESWTGVPLTAFTVIAFLECKGYEKEYKETITKALDYININVVNLKNNYALAIAAYAFALGKRTSEAETILKTLMKNAFNVENRLMYWEKNYTANSGETDLSTKVEIAAYAILAHCELKIPQDVALVVRWLISQRNKRGGFSSSQDTSIALQALSEYAILLYSKELNVDIKLTFNKVKLKSEFLFKLNETDRLVQKYQEIPPYVKSVSIFANGTGTASLQVSHSFRTAMNESGAFSLSVMLDSSTTDKYLTLNIHAKRQITEIVPVTMIEVTLPSGFVYDSSIILTDKKYGIKVSC